jgi:hypothetical protein
MAATTTTQEAEKLYEDTAGAIGHVAIQWNSLCGVLGDIFVDLVASENRTRGYAAWHGLRSDRSQRDMLEGVIKAMLPTESKLREEFIWLFGRVTSVENARNDIVHSPYAVLFRQDTEGDFDLAMIADAQTGHRRALNLKDKDIVSECRLVGHRTTVTMVYAMQLGRLIKIDPIPELPASLKRPPWQPLEPQGAQ